ncbi:hypothetical protein SARC_03250 [Sphaeroforma arctica JP610]|uniref:Uncharacterized protein n=1 Tax=Sphaeroforma arctica JP610 TaxID=667725 RepID=A0A0L0G8I1_9EUKA|nr:hypothetical protein SARC_03250 [Sphaeroforma arctica JP610]KNC84548.1 hypothetical protein SARC_03250 [Sphaeroforma arctica JP610]|eukprot:XP_014158450.1 hypothetical protein SARC_03250 [Sphaeroforma arctica JP610]
MVTLTVDMSKTAMSQLENSLYERLTAYFHHKSDIDFSTLRNNIDIIKRMTYSEFQETGVEDVTEHLSKSREKLEVALVGDTGAGKSTLFNALTGLRFGRIMEYDADAVSRNVLRFESNPAMQEGTVQVEVVYLTASQWGEDRELLRRDSEIDAEDFLETVNFFGYDTKGKSREELVEILEDNPKDDPNELFSKFGTRRVLGPFTTPESARSALSKLDEESSIILEIKITARAVRVTDDSADTLPGNISLVDIPGLGDISPLRNNKSRRFLRERRPYVLFLLSRDTARVSMRPWNTLNFIDSHVGFEKITIIRTRWDGTRKTNQVDIDLSFFKKKLESKYLQEFKNKASEGGEDNGEILDGDYEFAEREKLYFLHTKQKIQNFRQLPATIREHSGCDSDELPVVVKSSQYAIFDISEVQSMLKSLAVSYGDSLLIEIAAVANGWLNFDCASFKAETNAISNPRYLRKWDRHIRRRATAQTTKDTVGTLLKQQLDAFKSNHRGLKSILQQRGRGERYIYCNGEKQRLYIDLHTEMLAGFDGSSRLLKLFLTDLDSKALHTRPPYAVLTKIKDLQRAIKWDFEYKPWAVIGNIMSDGLVYVDGKRGMQKTKENIMAFYESKKDEIAAAVSKCLVTIAEKAHDGLKQIVIETLQDFNRIERVLSKSDTSPKRPIDNSDDDNEQKRIRV